MYAHTDAYMTFKKQTQQVLDFAVLIASSVPELKKTIKLSKKEGEKTTHLAKIDFFNAPSSPNELLSYSQQYKSELSKYVILSNFSFFEAYVTDVIDEMFKFHGGKEEMIRKTKDRCKGHIDPSGSSIIESRKKLQDSYKKKNHQKYKKHTSILKKQNFKFPSELLSHYGLKKVKDELKKIKSAEMPDLLQDGFHIDLTDDEVKGFHTIREFRNKIAHGNKNRFNLREAMECNKVLKNLAVKIDRHFVKNFFIIEVYS